MKDNHLTPESFSEAKIERERLKGHLSKVLWLTGLSGSGKSTIAKKLELELLKNNYHTICLDGDNVRSGLNIGLGFSNHDRKENLRRVGEVCKLMLDSGLIVIATFIAPSALHRELIKKIIGQDKFIEIFVNTSLEECEKRDVKGLYAKARSGVIPNFTGISAPYDVPKSPDIEIKTSELSVDSAVNKIYNYIKPQLEL